VGEAGAVAIGDAAAAGESAFGEACSGAGADAGGATKFCCGGADWAKPDGDIASKPTRHKAGARNLDSNAVFRRSLNERIIPSPYVPLGSERSILNPDALLL
jgi:hypothetical protein